MNWKKIMLTVVGGSLAGSVGGWVQNTANGVNIPFTSKTILIPAALTAVSALAALFVKSPIDNK